MFPREIPSAALPVAVTSALRPVQFPRQPNVRLVITRILRPPHPARPAGRRCPPPPVPLRFTASRPAAHPPPQRCSAPRPAASCLPFVVTHSRTMPPAPKYPLATHWELRFENVVRVVHIARSRGHLRALRRQALSSSFPALPHSYRRLCSLVIPAGTLDPAPCGGKEHLSVLRSQNPVCTGFAKHRQPAGQGSSTSILGPARRSLGEGGCRAKLGGQAWFGP